MSSRHRQFTSLRTHFPLKTVESVIGLVKRSIESNHVDLTFLSLLMGYLEHSLTCSSACISTTSSTYTTNYNGHCASQSNRGGPSSGTEASGDTNGNGKDRSTSPHGPDELQDIDKSEIPWIKWENIEPLYKKFVSQIKGAVEQHPKKASREVIKKVVDCIWSNLSRGYYTNKPHLQTLYSYITDDKLDRFGVSYAVAAACQVLELNDVRLALSEDHAWVTFGEPENEQTAEISWRGKGTEDRRGQPVVTANCWLYLNGYPVLCTPPMVFAALMTSMNPCINNSVESSQLATIQTKILWMLYENGYLAKYPMAVDCLGDIEEVGATLNAPKSAGDLFRDAIDINKKFYENHHVYPHIFMAGYYFRNGRFKEALHSWADAATVIRRYNYTRDDEEIYKEFLEIANDLIPHMVKVVSAGGCEPGKVSKIPFLLDPECFASLLAFYDGLCGWEEESPTPVLHIGWAKPFVSTISKFTSHVRSKAQIRVEDDDIHQRVHIKSSHGHLQANEESQSNSDNNTKGNSPKTSDSVKSDKRAKIKEESKSPSSPVRTPDEIIKSIEEGLKEDGERIEQDLKSGAERENTARSSSFDDQLTPENGNKSSTGLSTKSASTSNSLNISDSLSNENDQHHDENGEATVYLQSQKMIGLKDLLLADKLNTSAIQLQLTAQSQVHISKRPRLGSFGSHHQQHGEFDFLATTTISTSVSSVSGVRSSKRTRRDL